MKMAKRELIDRVQLREEIFTTTEWNGDVHRIIYERSLDDAKEIPEKEIVNPYLEKLKKKIEEIESAYGLDKATKYGNKDAEQQKLSYSTMMMYEIADIMDDIKEAINDLFNGEV